LKTKGFSLLLTLLNTVFNTVHPKTGSYSKTSSQSAKQSQFHFYVCPVKTNIQIQSTIQKNQTMKKIIIAALFAASIISSAFAADASKVSLKIMDNFKKEFRNAAQVEWTIKEQFTKADFKVNGIAVEAFFDKEGELIGTSRHAEFNQLPLSAIEKIQQDYANYQVSSTIEFDQKGDRNFYVSLEKGNKKQILVVSLYGEVSKFEGLGK
jgi:hypothetical protein